MRAGAGVTTGRRCVTMRVYRRGTGRNEAEPGKNRREFSRIQLLSRILVAGVGLGTLVILSEQSIRAELHASTNSEVAAWNLDANYWKCLSTQAHSLLMPGERVRIVETNLANWVTLEKVIGGWTVPVTSGQSATVTLQKRDRGSCLGSVVVEYRPASNGTSSRERVGSGDSLTSHHPLPNTPL